LRGAERKKTTTTTTTTTTSRRKEEKNLLMILFLKILFERRIFSHPLHPYRRKKKILSLPLSIFITSIPDLECANYVSAAIFDFPFLKAEKKIYREKKKVEKKENRTF
jgi:hypothetical protein